MGDMMGIYLNPSNDRFAEALRSEIYIDKTGQIADINKVIQTQQKYICVSRPRRFGKTMAASMLAAYYSRGSDSAAMFGNLQISGDPGYKKHLNSYNVLFINMQDFLSEAPGVDDMLDLLASDISGELAAAYPHISGELAAAYPQLYGMRFSRILNEIYDKCKIPFVFIIDEWDCIFRVYQNDNAAQRKYLDFLRLILKDKPYVGLAYMTGILPIKKYGIHSALNMFNEFSMIEPRQMSRYTGFTQGEILFLCDKYRMGYEEIASWYDGYRFSGEPAVYNPSSVISAVLSRRCSNYWNQTESYEALKIYIELNYDGLKDSIIRLLAGGKIIVETGGFTNDMVTFSTSDDILTLLIHLGYLGYDSDTGEAFIPNKEITSEFVAAIRGTGWNDIIKTLKSSYDLLQATWRGDSDAVADYVAAAHLDTSILSYNDENALSYTVSLAYYSAREFYAFIREMPAGKGFADIVLMPKIYHIDKPAMILELKWDHSASGAIKQIEDQKYVGALKNFKGKILLVGINYDKKTKKHDCVITELTQ
jgi:hypothetical protein